MSQLVEVDLALRLGSKVSGFVEREAQTQMAQLVGNAINTNQNALIEAGTGTGKTFAYLLPAISSGKKTIVSTGTKTLQDQLYQKDIPLINEAFGASIALLKGRANYLCPERLKRRIDAIESETSREVQEQLSYVYQWAESTRSGDLTEILDGGEVNLVHSAVTSTTDNCLGQDCPEISRCPLYKARQAALDADLVVVNHHLLFADLALKESDFGRLLPDVDIVILDEAHQVAEIARNFYGDHLSSGQMQELGQDVIREQRLVGQDDPLLIESVNEFSAALSGLTKALLQHDDAFAELVLLVASELELVDLSLASLIQRLDYAAERSPGLTRCYQRACELSDRFTWLTESNADADVAHWVERRDRSFVLHLMPLDIASHLSPLLNLESKSWIFVSATLAMDGDFKHIKSTLGYEKGLEACYASPFDFQNQVAAYVPTDLLEPRDPNHTLALLQRVLPLARSHSGRTLMLFTSHRALQIAGRLLSSEHDVVFIMQGALPKARLLQKFREIPACILLATHSFWEGVDLKGADLRLLVIDKLPFTSPDDPVFEARMNHTNANGGNGFREVALPETAITLKQGFGRLIRQETDRGLFVLGDRRVQTKGYGKTLRRSLPEMPWLQDQQQAMEFLEKVDQ